MHLPVRPLADAWPAPLVRRGRRWFWRDPRVLFDEADADPDDFRSAMSALHVGSTIKITGTDRHPEADGLLLGLELADARIADIGASDGSTSVDLVRRLPGFASFVIADLYLEIEATGVGRRSVFLAPEGHPILVVGPRALAWPAQSRFVRALYRRTLRRAVAARDRRRVLLLNPAAQRLIADDARVGFRRHDVFRTWDGEPPTIMKVANLLRRLYFDDAEIDRALGSIFAGLAYGGHLLVVDNPRIDGIDERSGLYRCVAGGFSPVAYGTHRPEIDDLVLAFRAPEDSGASAVS